MWMIERLRFVYGTWQGFPSVLVETWQCFIGLCSQVDVDKYPFLITLQVCLAALKFKLI